MKCLDPLRAKKTFIRKKLGHTMVSAIKASYGLKEHKNALWRLHVFDHNIIETLWCYKWTLLNSLETFFI